MQTNQEILINVAEDIVKNTLERSQLPEGISNNFEIVVKQIIFKGFIDRGDLLQLTSFLRYIE